MTHRPRWAQGVAVTLLAMTAVAASAILVYILWFVLKRGLPMITPEFLLSAPRKMGRAGGIFPTIVGTVLVTGLGVLIATPLGVGTAVYLTEYTREGRLTRIIRFGADCLAGVPSIIFGLFGFVFFVVFLGMGWSILSGALTLTAMTLPTIIRTSEEAIRAVPANLREVSYSLGAGKWQTVTRIVLPAALPGILTGVILSVGRCVGETAATIFTVGLSLRLPGSVLDSSRTMAVHFYILAREGLSMPHAYGTAAVLVMAILLLNVIAYATMGRLMKKLS